MPRTRQSQVKPRGRDSEASTSVVQKTEVSESKVNDFVTFVLLHNHQKGPIKRHDLAKAVLKEESRTFKCYLKCAQEKLHDVFGLTLTEMPSKAGFYMVTNTMENPDLHFSDQQEARYGVLMAVFAVIFMSGGSLSDKMMFSFMTDIGLSPDEVHEEFGDIRKLLTQDLVHEGYLKYTRVPNIDPTQFEFALGDRALVETTKRKILKFVCKMHDGVDIRTWVSQYQEVLHEEGKSPDDDYSPVTFESIANELESSPLTDDLDIDLDIDLDDFEASDGDTESPQSLD